MDSIPTSLLSDVTRLKKANSRVKINQSSREPRAVEDTEKPISTPKQKRTARPPADLGRPPAAPIQNGDMTQILRTNNKTKVLQDIFQTEKPTPKETIPNPTTNANADQTFKTLTTRKEVAQLQAILNEMTKSLGVDDDGPYPSEMDAFMSIIREETKLYDTVFNEIIRQVSVNMIERGEVLKQIRDRYQAMMTKIPLHVMKIHTELIANRKLNVRLSEELFQTQDHITLILKDLDFIREHDATVSMKAHEAQEKLTMMLNAADSADETMEQFHKLYQTQRNRLEKSLRESENEKSLWVEAAMYLSMQVGEESGLTNLAVLHRHEEARQRTFTT